METRKCICCGDEFLATSPNRKFCSDKCAGRYRRKDKPQTCEFCGKTFYIQSNNPAQKYCSPQCGHDARTGRPRPRPPVAHVDRTFDDWIHEADECNLDYGTYRGLIKMGKTYEELKAVAHLRPIALHAHASTASRKNYRD